MGTPLMPPFCEPRGSLHHPALGILPPFTAPHPQHWSGGGGGSRHTCGAWAWKPLPRNPRSPIPGDGDLTQAKIFSSPRGALMLGSHWELCFLDWEERERVKLQRFGRKFECIPYWESSLGGMYDPGREASYEGDVEGLTITRPIKPLGRAALATSSTTAPRFAPQGTPPSTAAHFHTALGAMGTVGPEPDFEVCAFIIGS